MDNNVNADFTINTDNNINAEYTLNSFEGFDCSFELFASGTVWGNIDGDINNQTDLINLLNTKVDLTSFEELSQTVEDNYNELTGDISDLTTTVTDNYNTLSDQISDLTSTVNDNYTSLDNRLTTAEGSILDLTDTVNDNYTELDGKITTTNNNLSILSQTVEDNNTAINNRVDEIVESFDGDISDLNDAIDNLSDTVADNYTDLDGKITNLSGTVSNNYTELNGKITDNTDDITTIQNTINSYGDIVSYNAAYFATSAQGLLADTALQPNDNISELVNDVGYITSASLPTVNNATITIQKNGSSVGTFTLNQANNATLNITVPTQASDIGAMPDTTTIEDLTTTAQLNALNSGATVTNIGQITTNQNNIADIRNLIPLQASTSNQLADKNFVNSSIATNTAYFIGTFNSVAELEAYSGPLTNNDYAFVATTDSAGNTLYDRYKYNADTQQWIFEYELNNSSFTSQQWASINSGITSGDVTLIGTALQPNDNISELTNDAGYITSASLPTVNNGTLDIQVNGTSIGTFTANQSGNTTANIVVPDSATWGNITGTLSNQTDLQTALNSKYDASNPDEYITSADLPTNYVTTDTAQDISGRKTFLGEKAIYFKQNVTTDKLGFTLYNPSSTELGALEWRPNTINGNALLALNCPQSGSNYVGFRYWSNINIIAPRPTTNGNYFIPVNITDGNTTVTANNNGTLNISTLLPNITVDQTYDATSANAQSGVAIAGAGFLKNTATGLYSISVDGNAATENHAINIGFNSTSDIASIAIGTLSTSGSNGISLGSQAKAGSFCVAIGSNAKTGTSVVNAIQLGSNSTNTESYTLYVSFNGSNEALGLNYKLLDGTTGLIPDARISSNIARTSSLATVATTGDYDDLTNKPTIPTVNNGTLTIQKNGTTVGTFTANDTNNVTANISVPTSISDLTDDTSSYPIDKAKSVVDQNSGSVKMWTGTKAQYDAIVTKDVDTLYDLTDTGQIYKGTTLISDKTTLYSTTGNNTDGAMTQDATTSELNNKANTSLSNLTATSSTNFDGQWVAVNTVIGTYTAVGDFAANVSSVLPNDNYVYECLVSVDMQKTATNNTAIDIFSDITADLLVLQDNGSTYARNTITVPVGTRRTLTTRIAGHAPTRIRTYIKAYRRVGTNA